MLNGYTSSLRLLFLGYICVMYVGYVCVGCEGVMLIHLLDEDGYIRCVLHVEVGPY